MSSSYATPDGLYALATTLPIIGFSAVALRFYSRRLQKAPLLLDDWLIVPAEFILVVMSVLIIIGVHGHGLGYTIPAETAAEAVNDSPPIQIFVGKIAFAILMISSLQVGLAKLSILFFFRRIFCGTDRFSFMNIATWFMIGITTTWAIAFFFANLFECGLNWANNWGATSTLNGGACINEQAMNDAYFYSDLIIDFILFILPMYNIWTLKMPVLRRLAVMGIFSFGALAMVASAMKTAIIIELEFVATSGFTSADKLLSTDPDIINSILIYWVQLECGIATIVACLPTLSSLIKKSPDLLRSLRSIISLHSLRSNGTARSQTRLGSSDQHSTSSQAQINDKEDLGKLENLEAGMGSRTFAMRDFDEQGQVLDENGITVKSYVTQETKMRV